MTRRVRTSLDIVARQRLAADPRASIWVEANAGSGKTFVLVARVLRLLLAGDRPESILCLTYTKAAAAEMRRRLSAQLAGWALKDDLALDAELAEMEGRPPEPAMRQRARTLFAHALETPGGLKINTIHAFCESVLHRFPLEARVPIDFAVIEDNQRQDMVLRACEGVLAEGLAGKGAVADAVETLFELMSDHAITEAIATALSEGRKLRSVLADRGAAKARLRRLTGYAKGATSAAILEEIIAGHRFGYEDYQAILASTPPKAGGSNFEDKLARLDAGFSDARALLGVFLTEDGAVPKRFPRKSLALADPALADALLAEAGRLEALANRLNHALLIERSEALLDVLGAISDRYEAEKRRHSLLDFDDLIEKLGDLFADRAQADWVKYKLDAGIGHILVDESQDTNDQQWRVVKALGNEFFFGDSAVERPRTLFAVGDEKQSIYSFQGADPALFGLAGAEFRRRAEAVGKAFETVRLRASFRTMPHILTAVDLVAGRDDIRAGLLAPLDAPVGHESAREDPGGMVTLWPPIQQQAEDTDPDSWPLEAPKSIGTAHRQMAERIVGEIAGWLASRRLLGPRGRPVRADDILILVQSRGALFTEIIRALRRQQVPTPGADQLAVTAHIGVLDLLALGDVLSNPADDLQLASLLRSPLFDVSEDDLFAIAHNRSGRLWDALAGSSLASARDASRRLRGWRGRLDFERPFEFFAEVLYADGGLRRFHARLGEEIDDVVAEFLELALAHEQTAQPSLQGFLAEMRARDISIRRELSETAGGVRVMTVHGAKGLEAPIVILADAASKPEGSQIARPVYVLADLPGPLLVHASARRDHVPETLDLRLADEAAQRAEYWRKLYVGMTRAEDELYVTGVLTQTGRLDGTWYEAVAEALAGGSEITTGADGAATALIYPAQRTVPMPDNHSIAAAVARPAPLHLPPLPAFRPIPVVTPSSAFEASAGERVLDTRLEGSLDAEAARREGLALHALLQHLGKVSPAARPQMAAKALPTLLPEAPGRHAALAGKAISLLGNPQFAALFGPQSRAEVPFLAHARRNGAPIRLAGRIDRILIASDHVVVIDYKSDADAPQSAQEVPSAYLTQLGLYALVAGQLFPGLRVDAAILWTTLESLMILPPEALRQAAAAFTMQ